MEIPEVTQKLMEENKELSVRVDILRKVYISQFNDNMTITRALADEKSAHAVTKAENERLHTILESCFEPGGNK